MKLRWPKPPPNVPESLLAPRWAFPLCAALALVAVWLPKYPAGIDLPQHANLFRLWVELGSGPVEYRELYRLNLFTPYVVPYFAGAFLTKFVGAMTATRCLLSFIALATPYFMTRWLRAVGAAPVFGLFGFLLAFGYTYIWGFISHAFALPLLFGYLAAFEQHYEAPTTRAIWRTMGWALLLFFSHGITFGVGAACAGLTYLFRGKLWERRRTAFHFVPIAVIATVWIVTRRNRATRTEDWFIDWDRLTTLFSGPFYATANLTWAAVSVVALLILAVVARPRIARSVPRIVPFAFSALLFAILPEWLASTWLVGTRFCVFVHAFSPALFQPRTGDRLARLLPYVTVGLVVAGLTTQIVRLQHFNEEVAGLDELTAALEPGADVRQAVTQSAPYSNVFGGKQFGQMPAWITAETGGLIENDSARYFQMPVQHTRMKFPREYHYIVARGSKGKAKRVVRKARRGARLIDQYGQWLLFEEEPLTLDGLRVVRSAQGWGELRRKRSVTKRRLKIGKQRFSDGLGTHAQSFIRLHADSPGSVLRGACGVNYDSKGRAKVRFRIRNSAGAVLFETEPLTSEMPPEPFSVKLGPDRELLLESLPVGSRNFGYADWVDLAVTE